MAVTLTKEFRTNFVLFVVACVALGLSIWAFAKRCKKDKFGEVEIRKFKDGELPCGVERFDHICMNDDQCNGKRTCKMVPSGNYGNCIGESGCPPPAIDPCKIVEKSDHTCTGNDQCTGARTCTGCSNNTCNPRYCTGESGC